MSKRFIVTETAQYFVNAHSEGEAEMVQADAIQIEESFENMVAPGPVTHREVREATEDEILKYWPHKCQTFQLWDSQNRGAI